MMPDRRPLACILVHLRRHWAVWSGLLALAILAAHLVITMEIKAGLLDLARELRETGEARSSVFYRVGPAVAAAIKGSTAEDYSILVRPFDRVGSGKMVTHTAFIRSSDREIAIRIRFNPLSGWCHLVGYMTIRDEARGLR
jgi:hypothetical protein